ncbi:MFS transporter [Bacillus methanolicus]|uniref:Putative MFS-type transporter YfnC n=1 Tax=Bacillus methanolicus (strain MGA3 / ATCC 53907) TaxID=796606 RepID=I3DYP6_BACMM|nr:MFS transporter [Bacillus methanolicus]AIE59448.1 putative MFS-type transporter YfnC [Bacillus methanolicus MGA3]EIJ79367.1 major facilitator superfamily fosmidomycin:cation antiporter [Bacillus methanolicus MGA3]UQD51514.1 MFS transporter [Bacillus methanolicus]
MSQLTAAASPISKGQGTTSFKILLIIGLCHLLNDSLQAVVPAMFPVLGKSMRLSYTQLGFIAFSLNMVSSIMQPVVGMYTDKKPKPYALPIGLTFTLFGILGLALAPRFEIIVISVLLIGLGSAVFHPEGSRVAYMAAGPRRGLAQSIYQVGGNSGQALAPLITAVVLVPLGQIGAAWFTLVAAVAVGLLIYIANWYSFKLKFEKTISSKKKPSSSIDGRKSRRSVWFALTLILFLIFARSWYIASMTNFYAFYAIHKYSISIKMSQLFLFAFLIAGAAGTFLGGPLSDRYGKKTIILLSMIAAAPLSILIPHVPPVAAFILLTISGFILMSSFSVTVVYAQELVPGKIGTMSGLTVGLAFGMGALGSIGIGYLADIIGLTKTIILMGYLPLLGILTIFLPSDKSLAESN